MKSLEQAIADECQKQGKEPSELTHLELDNKCKTDSVKAVEQLINLEVLSLAHTGISSLDGFPSLPKLRVLVLSDNKLTDASLRNLLPACLPALTKLDLANNSGIKSLDSLKCLQQLPALKCLDLDSCPVKKIPSSHQEVFKMLTDLEYLDNVDKNGIERDADDDDEDEEEEEGDEGGDEGEEADEGEDEGEEDDDEEEGAPAPPLHAQLLEQQPLDDDEEDYEEEAEEDDEEEEDPEEDEGEEASGSGSAKKRKRAPAEPQGGRDDDEEEEEEEDDE